MIERRREIMTVKQYVDLIVERSGLPSRYKRRLREDLTVEINQGIEAGETLEQIMMRMGTPEEITENIAEGYFGEIQEKAYIEYRSKATLFGLPFIHVVKSRHYFRQTRIGFSSTNIRLSDIPTAKGIIAIGMKAKGIIAFGNFTMGIISIGNLSLGLITIANIGLGLAALGNLGIGLLLALCNVGAGIFSAGNLIFGYAAIGNLAMGQYCIGHEVVGNEVFQVKNFYRQIDEITAFIHQLDIPAYLSKYLEEVSRLAAGFHIEYIIIPLIVLIIILLLLLCLRWLCLKKVENGLQ